MKDSQDGPGYAQDMHSMSSADSRKQHADLELASLHCTLVPMHAVSYHRPVTKTSIVAADIMQSGATPAISAVDG